MQKTYLKKKWDSEYMRNFKNSTIRKQIIQFLKRAKDHLEPNHATKDILSLMITITVNNQVYY